MLDSAANKIIAVDFDGTLCYGDNWPYIGRPNYPLIRWLVTQQREGSKLILWTCREGESLAHAIDWCKTFGLIFDAVNDNLKRIKELYGNNSRKIVADVYIDDKSIRPDDSSFPFTMP